ncbi:hypothetical protein KI743_13990 [Vibrio sp. D420a]|uniref:SulA-like leucine-rich domain-containing protein n=1 Tax=Vibrio sp. D420a TaxID=2836895 RepID=UPI0025547BC0|nr:SulA-like leucine-rich domain-containing protein [Vibrio sp. D420a]MDK9763113.1 hypothetical protein [Vibrio sp. D420a]
MIQAHVKAQHSSPLVQCAFSAASHLPQSSNQSRHQANLLARMALLSSQEQWLLFTAQTPRPSAKELSQFNICCERIIHMKPSRQMSEMETVEKAIRSRNASAIVASNQIDSFGQQYLRELAIQYQCEVFFVEHSTTHHVH